MYMGDLYLRQSSGCNAEWLESRNDVIRQPFAKGTWTALYRFYLFFICFATLLDLKSIDLIFMLCTGGIPLVEHFCTLE